MSCQPRASSQRRRASQTVHHRPRQQVCPRRVLQPHKHFNASADLVICLQLRLSAIPDVLFSLTAFLCGTDAIPPQTKQQHRRLRAAGESSSVVLSFSEALTFLPDHRSDKNSILQADENKILVNPTFEDNGGREQDTVQWLQVAYAISALAVCDACVDIDYGATRGAWTAIWRVSHGSLMGVVELRPVGDDCILLSPNSPLPAPLSLFSHPAVGLPDLSHQSSRGVGTYQTTSRGEGEKVSGALASLDTVEQEGQAEDGQR